MQDHRIWPSLEAVMNTTSDRRTCEWRVRRGRLVPNESTTGVFPIVLTPWSTTAEVAERHGLTPKTIRDHIARGDLEAVGRPYRISREAESAWVESRRQPTRTSSRRAAPARKPTATTTGSRRFRQMVQR